MNFSQFVEKYTNCRINKNNFNKSRFIVHLPVTPWEAGFSFQFHSFQYIMKSFLTLWRPLFTIWKPSLFEGKSSWLDIDLKSFLLTGLCELLGIRFRRIVFKSFLAKSKKQVLHSSKQWNDTIRSLLTRKPEHEVSKS